MNKTDLLLQMMEQPQHYTAEEWQEILADVECRELYTLMSKTQSAMDATRADQEVTDDMIDAEWQRLSDEKQEARSEQYSLLKFAAMFVGILMLSGIAFAAIHIASHYNAPKEQETKVIKNSQPSTSSPQLAEPDTIVAPQPKLYDNVPLGEIFEELSAYEKSSKNSQPTITSRWSIKTKMPPVSAFSINGSRNIHWRKLWRCSTTSSGYRSRPRMIPYS